MTKLLLNRRKLIEVDAEKILQGFANSNIRKEYSDSPEEVRLALFVAFDEPVGFGSTFPNAREFNNLFRDWCNNKNKYQNNPISITRKIK